MNQLQTAELTSDWSKDELGLIRETVAKNANEYEWRLFLTRCRKMGLDPLKPGHIHFVKYGNSPGTIIIGIDGFRSRAAAIGKHAGTRRGIVRDEKGRCIGAWCEVYRSDWKYPAREEVSLAEYNSGRGQWLKMPETMIKKVAEAAALRMAFPDELGGLYSDDEMAQAEAVQTKIRDLHEKLEVVAPPETNPTVNGKEALTNGEDAPQALHTEMEPAAPEFEQTPELPLENFVCRFGKNRGKKLSEISVTNLSSFLSWYERKLTSGNNYHPDIQEFVHRARQYLEQMRQQ